MKTLSLLFLLVCSAAIAASAVQKNALKPIKSIIIKQNAAVDDQSSGANEEDCTQFRLTEPVVKSYFKKAQVIESIHDYSWSGCKATGTVEFTNGDRGTWQINSSRLGFLMLSDGRSFSFFCRDTDCTEAPYAVWRGVNADDEIDSEGSNGR